MSDKREYSEYSARRELQNCGIRIHKRDGVAFNSGSETIKHVVSKLLAAYILKERGFRVDTEVEVPEGEIDIVAYGKPDEPPLCVEVETSPTEEIITDKLERYVYGLPLRDMLVINVNNVPVDMLEAKAHIEQELFGDNT